MPATLGQSLREAIYSQVIESDGCYLLIYSGRGEKLSFLSCLNKGSRVRTTTKLVVDFGLKKLGEKLIGERLTTLESLPETNDEEAAESYCLRVVREEVAKLHDNVDSRRLVVIVDPSSFFLDCEESKEDGIPAFHKSIAFHKEIANMAKSTKGISVVLLYDANHLSGKLMSNLMRLHQPLGSSMSGLTPKALKDEPLKRISTGKCYRTIVASQREVILLDPASQSVALLLPMTDDIEGVLPNDPLNIAHRDVAFTNNYTSHIGACPYWSSDVGSGCVLDPNVVRALDTRGRSFIEGYPCITALDYMVYDEKLEKKVDNVNKSKNCEMNGGGAIEYLNDSSNTPTTGNDPIPIKHRSSNQRLKAAANCRTTRLFP